MVKDGADHPFHVGISALQGGFHSAKKGAEFCFIEKGESALKEKDARDDVRRCFIASGPGLGDLLASFGFPVGQNQDKCEMAGQQYILGFIPSCYLNGNI